MNNIIQSSIFDPLVDYITIFNYAPCGASFIEFTLPKSFHIDDDNVRQYLSDATIVMCNGSAIVKLKGTIKDGKLASYLYAKHESRYISAEEMIKENYWSDTLYEIKN